MLNNNTPIEEAKVKDKVPRNYLNKDDISKVSFFSPYIIGGRNKKRSRILIVPVLLQGLPFLHIISRNGQAG